MAILTEEDDYVPSASPVASSSASVSDGGEAEAARRAADLAAKTKEAAEAKALGNEAFKKGDLQGALKAYHTALFLLIGLSRDVGFGGPKPAEGEQRQLASIDKEISLLYSNQAAVQLKKQNWPRALSCANDSLKKDPSNTKASFRKATALNSMGEVNKAKKLLAELDQNDTAVKTLLKQIDQEEAARSVKADASYKGMFSKKA